MLLAVKRGRGSGVTEHKLLKVPLVERYTIPAPSLLQGAERHLSISRFQQHAMLIAWTISITFERVDAVEVPRHRLRGHSRMVSTSSTGKDGSAWQKRRQGNDLGENGAYAHFCSHADDGYVHILLFGSLHSIHDIARVTGGQSCKEYEHLHSQQALSNKQFWDIAVPNTRLLNAL